MDVFMFSHVYISYEYVNNHTIMIDILMRLWLSKIYIMIAWDKENEINILKSDHP